LPLLLWVVVALSAALFAESALAARPRVAILPITGDGVLLDDLMPVEQALREGAARLDGHRLVSRENTLRELKSARELGLDCSPTATSCLVRLALVMEIDLLIVPRVSAEGSFLAVTASLIDVTSEREVGRVGRIVDRRSLGNTLGRLAADLLDQDPQTGTIVLTVEPKGAIVEIDGAVRGRAPLRSPIASLHAGEHTLVVHKDGYRAVRASIVVKPRAVVGFVVQLSESPTPTPVPAQAGGRLRELPATPAMSAARDEDRVDPRLVGGAVTAAIGVVTLLGAGVLAVSSASREDDGLTRGAAFVAATAGVLLSIGGLTFVGVALVE